MMPLLFSVILFLQPNNCNFDGLWASQPMWEFLDGKISSEILIVKLDATEIVTISCTVIKDAKTKEIRLNNHSGFIIYTGSMTRWSDCHFWYEAKLKKAVSIDSHRIIEGGIGSFKYDRQRNEHSINGQPVFDQRKTNNHRVIMAIFELLMKKEG